MSVFDRAVELARSGGQAGALIVDGCEGKDFAPGEKNFEFAVILRPDIPMQQVTGIPYVAAYGLVKAFKETALNVGIAWPYGIVVGDTPVGVVRTRAGYADGIFVVCGLALDPEKIHEAEALLATEAWEPEKLAETIVAAVGAWVDDVKAGRAVAGPLAPVLNGYFDCVALLGQKVDVIYPNGNVAYTARFGGVDVWGRAILVSDDGKETAITPEQASIRATRFSVM